jgi:hypothetical protein
MLGRKARTKAAPLQAFFTPRQIQFTRHSYPSHLVQDAPAAYEII